MEKSVVAELMASNDWECRLGRTMLQDVLAVVVSNLDLLMGFCAMKPAMRAFCVALVMAVLSPVMAELGAGADGGEGNA